MHHKVIHDTSYHKKILSPFLVLKKDYHISSAQEKRKTPLIHTAIVDIKTERENNILKEKRSKNGRIKNREKNTALQEKASLSQGDHESIKKNTPLQAAPSQKDPEILKKNTTLQTTPSQKDPEILKKNTALQTALFLKQRDDQIMIYRNNMATENVSKKAIEENKILLAQFSSDRPPWMFFSRMPKNKHPYLLCTVCDDKRCWKKPCPKNDHNCCSLNQRTYILGHFSHGSQLSAVEKKTKWTKYFDQDGGKNRWIYFYYHILPYEKNESKYEYKKLFDLSQKAHIDKMIQGQLERFRPAYVQQDSYFKKIAAQEAKKAQQVQNLNHDELD